MKCPKCGSKMRSIFGLYWKCSKCSHIEWPDYKEAKS